MIRICYRSQKAIAITRLLIFTVISQFFHAFRFIEYKPTSLERNYKYDVLTELDLGVDIDLITPDVYTVDGTEILDTADEKLLEEDVIPHQDSRR